MAFNPFQEAQKVARAFGVKSDALSEAASSSGRAQSLINRYLPGLPGTEVSGMGLMKRTPKSTFGGTKTQTDANGRVILPRGHVPLSGIANAKLEPWRNGGTRTVIGRKTKYMEFITDDDLEDLDLIAAKIKRMAEQLSQGSLSTRQLAQMGHPYSRSVDNYMFGGRSLKGIGSQQRKLLGRTLSRGVSNLAVLNRQSGEVAGSWDVDIRIYGDGVEIELINNSDHAKYTAFGTRNMKAHGPYSVAPAKYLPEINAAWLRITRNAYHRQKAQQSAGGGA